MKLIGGLFLALGFFFTTGSRAYSREIGEVLEFGESTILAVRAGIAMGADGTIEKFSAVELTTPDIKNPVVVNFPAETKGIFVGAVLKGPMKVVVDRSRLEIETVKYMRAAYEGLVESRSSDGTFQGLTDARKKALIGVYLDDEKNPIPGRVSTL